MAPDAVIEINWRASKGERERCSLFSSYRYGITTHHSNWPDDHTPEIPGDVPSSIFVTLGDWNSIRRCWYTRKKKTSVENSRKMSAAFSFRLHTRSTCRYQRNPQLSTGVLRTTMKSCPCVTSASSFPARHYGCTTTDHGPCAGCADVQHPVASITGSLRHVCRVLQALSCPPALNTVNGNTVPLTSLGAQLGYRLQAAPTSL